VNGRSYLPDFFLPQLNAITEIKPTPEAAKQAEPLLKALAAGTKCGVFLLCGSPDPGSPPRITKFVRGSGEPPRVFTVGAAWHQCVFCDHVGWRGINDKGHGCAPEIKFLSVAEQLSPRVEHAMAEARRARFEHGEDGTPRPYRPATRNPVLVYVAGSVLEPEADYPA
jgi:hypothetical protein